MPPPEKGIFVKALFRKFSFNEYFAGKTRSNVRYEGEHALTMLTDLFELYRLTLREQEHCCSLLSLSIRTTTEINYILHPLLLCFLIVLKVKEPETYKSFITEEISSFELLDYLRNKEGAEKLLDSHYGKVLEAYIVSCKTYTNESYKDLERYKATAEATSISSSAGNVEKERANKILQILNDFEWSNNVLDYLVKKLEIVSRFKT